MTELRIYGADEPDRMKEIADAYAELVTAVATELAGVPVGVRVGSMQRVCDGECGARSEGFDLPDGWVHRDNRDYCPDCLSSCVPTEQDVHDTTPPLDRAAHSFASDANDGGGGDTSASKRWCEECPRKTESEGS